MYLLLKSIWIVYPFFKISWFASLLFNHKRLFCILNEVTFKIYILGILFHVCGLCIIFLMVYVLIYIWQGFHFNEVQFIFLFFSFCGYCFVVSSLNSICLTQGHEHILLLVFHAFIITFRTTQCKGLDSACIFTDMQLFQDKDPKGLLLSLKKFYAFIFYIYEQFLVNFYITCDI